MYATVFPKDRAKPKNHSASAEIWLSLSNLCQCLLVVYTFPSFLKTGMFIDVSVFCGHVLPPRFFRVNKALKRWVRSRPGSTSTCPTAATCSTVVMLLHSEIGCYFIHVQTALCPSSLLLHPVYLRCFKLTLLIKKVNLKGLVLESD